MSAMPSDVFDLMPEALNLTGEIERIKRDLRVGLNERKAARARLSKLHEELAGLFNRSSETVTVPTKES